jgi:hypothetical protein
MLRVSVHDLLALAPASSVMNSRRLMSNKGVPSQGGAADHTSQRTPQAGSLPHVQPIGGRVSRSLGQT